MAELRPSMETLLNGGAGKPLRALVGFDGSVDVLFRVVQGRSGGEKVLFSDIGQFGRDILTRAGLSGGYELTKLGAKVGGNAPLMSAALAALEIDVTCVGALGLPDLDPVYKPLAQKCGMLAVAEAPSTVVFEFGDGKLMFSDTEPLETLNWDRLVAVMGLEKIKQLVLNADLLALVNWADMSAATGLWRGVLEEILEKGPRARGKKIFFDLADFTRRGDLETRDLAALLGRFRPHGEVTLGLNENEARQLEQKLGLAVQGAEKASLEDLGRRLFDAVGVDALVIHPREGATVFSQAGSWTVPGRMVAKPVLSTGGGDNFNAGFCVGWLHGLGLREAAAFAVLVSSSYVENGRSPGRSDIKALLSAH